MLRSLSLLLLAAVLAAPAALAQARASDEARPSPNALVGQTIGTTDVTVTYGRPSAKGRLLFGPEADKPLAPYDAVWRTGANEAATITFSNDVRVEGKPIPAGTYSLFTVPGDGEWTVVFNATANQWGAFRYDREQDVMRVEVQSTTADAAQEQFLITFEGASTDAATMTMAWGTVRVPVRIASAAPSAAPSGRMGDM